MYLTGYSDKAIRPLVLIMPKMSEYVKPKVKDGDKNKNNKVMYFDIDDEKLLHKYKAIGTMIEDLKNIKLNTLPLYDDRAYSDKVYTNFRGLDVPEDDIDCESFAVILIDSLLVYNNIYYLQVYLDNFAHKIVNKQMTDCFDENLFED